MLCHKGTDKPVEIRIQGTRYYFQVQDLPQDRYVHCLLPRIFYIDPRHAPGDEHADPNLVCELRIMAILEAYAERFTENTAKQLRKELDRKSLETLRTQVCNL